MNNFSIGGQVGGYMQRQAPELSEVSVRRLTHKNDVTENPVKAAHAVGGVQLIPAIDLFPTVDTRIFTLASS
mgnify:CR=1 FL=1